LPERLSFLSVGNTRDSFWPKAIASLPDTAEPFLCQFVGLPLPDAQEEAAPDLLALLGVPKRSRSGIRIDRAKTPTADELGAHLFPSIVAATVDERSFRFLSVEAFPFACVGLEARYGNGGLAPNLTIDVKFRSGK
jgi:hypothetical protein